MIRCDLIQTHMMCFTIKSAMVLQTFFFFFLRLHLRLHSCPNPLHCILQSHRVLAIFRWFTSFVSLLVHQRTAQKALFSSTISKCKSLQKMNQNLHCMALHKLHKKLQFCTFCIALPSLNQIAVMNNKNLRLATA